MAATTDDIYALLQTVNSKLDTLTSKVNTAQTDIATIKSQAIAINDKIDILSGDTTATNVLDKVLAMEKRVKTIEFKVMKGR